MPITSLLALTAMSSQASKPILWLNPNGSILMQGQKIEPQINAGVTRVRYPAGTAYSFAGSRSGILLGDAQPLKPKGSFSISTYLYLRSFVNDGPGAQIFFRGDDRCGYDSYSLVLTGDKLLNFSLWDGNNEGMTVHSEIPLEKWVHVVASYDEASGRMDLWMDGQEMGFAYSSRKPVYDLDGGWTPGVGIGNIQNDKGPHNQPFNGTIADFRFYNTVVTPEIVGYESGLWSEAGALTFQYHPLW